MRADWLRNIIANIVFEAQDGRRRLKARAERVSGPQAADVLLRYISEHKFYTRTMMRSIGIDLGAFTEEGLRAELEKEVVLAIKPVDLP